MLMPSIFSNNSLFDDFFNDSWFDDRDFKDVEKKLYGHRAKNVMNTDVKENENGYELISQFIRTAMEEEGISREREITYIRYHKKEKEEEE